MTAALPTGYLDAYGNVWVFNDGRTVIDGKLVRGSAQRRMLVSGEAYWGTDGVRRVVA